MKLRLFSLLLMVLIPGFTFAQSCLTIFSEDGDKFILFLNGQQQNSEPQTNLRIDGLTQPYYKAKVVFEDKSKGELSKNVPVVDPATNAYADVVYHIKSKKGDLKIAYYSAQPMPPSYTPPPGQYVMHYGEPDQSTTVTQTTVTQTTGTNTTNGSVSIGFGAGNGGVNMNVNVNDPNMNGGVTQTTTTTTTTSSSSYSASQPNNGYNEPQGPAPCRYAMGSGNFSSAKQTIQNASFEETKLSTAKSILNSNCFSTDQVIQVCNLFGFEASKLDFAKYAYSRTTDPGNYFKVGNVFSFDASKTELNNYISGGR